MISLVTQSDGSARRVPWIALALVVAMAAVHSGQRAERGVAEAQAEAALAEAVAYFHEKPYVLLPDRMQAVIPPEMAQQIRDDYETERAALGIYSAIPDIFLQRAQTRFDALAEAAFRKQDALPANVHGFRGSGDPPRRYFEHAFFHLSLASLAVAIAAVLLLGIPLEDVWGSVVFALFAAAMIPLGAVAFGALHPGSMSPWLGASGLAAALLGASTLRWLTSGSPRLLGGLPLPAWLVVPGWLAAEYVVVRAVTLETLPASPYLVHSAMLGAGLCGAFAIRALGLEEALAARWSDSESDLRNPVYEKAMTLREKGKREEALALLEGSFESRPDGDTALGVWDIARDLGEPARGAAAALWYVRDALRHGQATAAVKQWLEVAEWGGEIEVEPNFFVRIADALLREGESQPACDAIDRAASSRGGLSGALAVRAVRMTCELDAGLARRVAEQALAGEGLSSRERSDLEEKLRTLPAAPAAPAAVVERRPEPGGGAEAIASTPSRDALSDPGAAAPAEAPAAEDDADLDALDPSAIDPALLDAAIAEAAADEEWSADAAADEEWSADESADGAWPGQADPSMLDPAALDLEAQAHELDAQPGPESDPLALDPRALDPSALDPNALDLDALDPGALSADALEDRSEPPGEGDGPLLPPAPEAAAHTERASAGERFELGGLRPLRSIGVVPIEFEEGGIKLDAEGRGKTRLRYERIEAVSVAAVHGLAAKPVVVIDLVMNWLGAPDDSLDVLRIRSDSFDPRKLAPEASSGIAALRAFVSRIVEGSSPTCLPGEAAVRGQPFSVYTDLASYHREVLSAEDASA